MKKNIFTILFLKSSACIFQASLFSIAYGQIGSTESSTAQRTFLPGEDSSRLSFELSTPRRFATRYNGQTRTLEIRVIPANAREFSEAHNYDTRHIHRVIIEEKNGEVILGIQFKNEPLGWIVDTQNNPWRLLVDLWKLQPRAKPGLEEEWKWQDGLSFLAQASPAANSVAAEMPVMEKNISEMKMDTKQEQKEEAKAHKYKKRSDLHAKHAKQENKKHREHKEYKKETTLPIINTNNDKKYSLPEIFSRIDSFVPITEARLGELKEKIGSLFGQPGEFDSAKTMAQELYRAGHEDQAVGIYRRLAALSEIRFKQDPEILRFAGEAAYLTGNFNLANDYFRTLVTLHPGSSLVPLAQLRLADITELDNVKNPGNAKVTDLDAQEYAQLALNDSDTSSARIAAATRLLLGTIENSPEDALQWQRNLQSCVDSKGLAFQLAKHCLYDLTLLSIEKDDINTADGALQYYKKLVTNDPRNKDLEKRIDAKIVSLLKKVESNKQWYSWIDFEKNCRPALLEFSLINPEYLLSRAEAWQSVGENKKAANLYKIFFDKETDNAKKDEAASLAALLLYRENVSDDAENFLRKVELDSSRKTAGLTDNTIAALKEISLAPYKSKRALGLLIDEMKLGKYVERDLSTLVFWANSLRHNPAAEDIYQKISQYPAKTPEDIKLVETATMDHADDLREAGDFEKSGDFYSIIANLTTSSRQTEAAYKAGIVYARVGLFDKAKASWQLAANSVNDKRYASLASERLARIN